MGSLQVADASRSRMSLIKSIAKATNALEDGFAPLLEECQIILSSSRINKEEVQLAFQDINKQCLDHLGDCKGQLERMQEQALSLLCLLNRSSLTERSYGLLEQLICDDQFMSFDVKGAENQQLLNKYKAVIDEARTLIAENTQFKHQASKYQAAIVLFALCFAGSLGAAAVLCLGAAAVPGVGVALIAPVVKGYPKLFRIFNDLKAFKDDLVKTTSVLGEVQKDSLAISADLKIAASRMDRLHSSCSIPREMVLSSLDHSTTVKREVLLELWEDMKSSRVPTVERLSKQLEESIAFLQKAIVDFEVRLHTVREFE